MPAQMGNELEQAHLKAASEMSEIGKLHSESPKEAKVAANIRGTLERVGTPIGPMDTLIAGIALAHQGTLVTHNTKEFARIADLTITDWY